MTTHERDPLRSRYDVRTKWLLGKGADGGVLRGIQKSTGVFRALKFQSRTAWSADKELEVLRAMSHPNVASLIEWFEPSSDGKRPQRVLVFAETDTDLFSFLGRHRPAASQGGPMKAGVEASFLKRPMSQPGASPAASRGGPAANGKWPRRDAE